MVEVVSIIVAMLIYDVIRMFFKLKHTEHFYAVVVTIHGNRTRVYLRHTKAMAEYSAKAYRRLFTPFGAKVAILHTDSFGECYNEGILK